MTVQSTNEDARIRALRPPKPQVDPWKAHGAVAETERRPGGVVERALTVFLAGSECPYTCAFCDLWRFTTDGPTPPGALPRQLREALDGCERPLPQRLKLYNASNFFDARAVPRGDWQELASLAEPFNAVTVESHASMIGARTLEFARMLRGRLEVAVGLETIHPVAMRKQNKRLDCARFVDALSFLRRHDIDIRVFVLLGAPHIPQAESVEWAVNSVTYAVGHGADVVSLIPTRGGNGEMERLQSLGEFTPPSLGDLEDALDQCLVFADLAVTADLWDVDRLVRCTSCRDVRVQRLERINLTGAPEPRVACAHCDGD